MDISPLLSLSIMPDHPFPNHNSAMACLHLHLLRTRFQSLLQKIFNDEQDLLWLSRFSIHISNSFQQNNYLFFGGGVSLVFLGFFKVVSWWNHSTSSVWSLERFGFEWRSSNFRSNWSLWSRSGCVWDWRYVLQNCQNFPLKSLLFFLLRTPSNFLSFKYQWAFSFLFFFWTIWHFFFFKSLTNLTQYLGRSDNLLSAKPKNNFYEDSRFLFQASLFFQTG